MVLGVVNSDSDFMPPFIFPHVHKKCLEEVMLTWVKAVTAGEPNVWQQDYAQCHRSRRIQSCLSDNFGDHITPKIYKLNFPDSNRFAFFAWDAVVLETNKTRY